jgi:hypothetical protein
LRAEKGVGGHSQWYIPNSVAIAFNEALDNLAALTPPKGEDTTNG